MVTTLRSLREKGDTIHAFHEVIGDHRCSHRAQLDWEMLERRLGPDFELVRRRAYFLSPLKCSVCAKDLPMMLGPRFRRRIDSPAIIN